MASSDPKQEPKRASTFKDQLDERAEEDRQNAQGHEPNSIVEMIKEYIPAAAKILGTDEKNEEPTTKQSDVPGPPNRPDHDAKIEEFVRDQHRSNADNGSLGASSQ